jgi:site-specific DNA-methyltransferase (adenine-specific)
MIYVFSKSGAYYNRVDISGNFKAFKSFEREYQFDKNRHGGNNRIHKAEGNDGTKRCALSIINVANSAKKGNHPTEKPSDLYKWLIERYCPAEGTVLDPTAGSCNSVFQAFAMGRSGIGIEKDAIFYKKAEERLNALP